MQLTIDLTGRDVLVTGSDVTARQAVRRYEQAGATVYRLSAPAGTASDGPLPERPFLVAAVDDGDDGWLPLLERCREPASRWHTNRPPVRRATSPWSAADPARWIC